MVMIKYLDCADASNPEAPFYYHQFENYHGDPEDDTTWEPGESYRMANNGDYVREYIKLPYDPAFVSTNEKWLKDKILAYAAGNPLMCDITHFKGRLSPDRTNWYYPEDSNDVMYASIPKAAVGLCVP